MTMYVPVVPLYDIDIDSNRVIVVLPLALLVFDTDVGGTGHMAVLPSDVGSAVL